MFSEIRIKAPENVNGKETVHLDGNVEFRTSMKNLKWQKYQNGKFVDIDIHKSKYSGSTNDLQKPKLIIHDVDTEDEVDYRLQVQLEKTTETSNSCSFKVMCHSGKLNIHTIDYRLSLIAKAITLLIFDILCDLN